MSTQNELTAKVIADILSKGMSISGYDVAELVKSEAAAALGEVRGVMSANIPQKEKLSQIEGIMDKYNLKS